MRFTSVAAVPSTVAVNIASVSAVQRVGTRLVDVTYDVEDPEGAPMTITLWLSEDGGTTFPIECVTVTGDVGPGIESGTGKQIVWDAGVDYSGYHGGEYILKVVADDD